MQWYLTDYVKLGWIAIIATKVQLCRDKLHSIAFCPSHLAQTHEANVKGTFELDLLIFAM